MYLQSPGLWPSVVSSLDVAHSLIHFGICPFTLGRRKEIQGVKEGERVREELSNHIWVDGTHGESTPISPQFSSMLIPGLYVLQPFLFFSSKIHLPNSLCPGQFHFSTFCFYPIRAHYSLSSLLPVGLNRSQMLQYERQLRSVIFFSATVTGSGPLWKKERGTKGEKLLGSREHREGRTKITSITLSVPHSTCMQVPNTEPHSCIRTQHAFLSSAVILTFSFEWKCV